VTSSRTLALAAVVALGGCNIDLGGEPSLADALDLGTAAYPTGAPESKAAVHVWNARLRPSTYRVGYALGAQEEVSVEAAYARWARSVRFQNAGGGRFKWVPPPGCTGDMHCAYDALAERGMPDLEPLIERFRARQRAAHLSSLDLAALVVTFVQNIRYEVPKDEPFGILPPPLVVSEQRGDCDSKALLGHVLLHALGIDSVLLSSDAHRHAMLGIALPASGTKITYAGRSYAVTEMTAKGSPIGHMNSSLTHPNDWRPIPIHHAR
jgi:hypothetical protein